MDKTKRKRILGLITFLIVVPLLSMFWNLTLGVYLLFGGLLISSIISFSLAREARKQIFKYQDTCPSPDRAGEIIWVSLDDEHGNPLTKAEAKHRMDKAHAKAGPMDRIVAKPIKK
jgi:hypothetical protein